MKRPGFLALVLGLCIGGMLYWFFKQDPADSDALRLRALATRILAEQLQSPKEAVLIVSNPFAHRSTTGKDIRAMEQAGLRGAAKGLGVDLKPDMIGLPALKPGAETNPRAMIGNNQTTTPMSFLVTDDSFDQLLEKHPGRGIVISLIGLPAEIESVRCWTQQGPPRFGLLLPDLRIIGVAADVKAAMKRGKLAAFVVNKPGAPGSEVPVGGEDRVEFEKRFLLVTPETLDTLEAKYPDLLPKAE